MNINKASALFVSASLLLASQAVVAQKQDADDSFKKAEKALIPLESGQIERLFRDTMKITESVNRKPASLSRVVEVLDVSPGAETPDVVLSPGYVTSVRFIDSAGNPWPITSNTVGNPAWFNLQKPENLKPGNLITLSALSPKAHSNVIVTLKDLNIPITIVVKTHDLTKQKKVDGNITFQVPGLSPLADKKEDTPPPPFAADDVLVQVLNGVTPENATRLSVSSPSVSVWQIDDALYVRTSEKLVWPAFLARSSSGSLNVYKIPVLPRLVLSSKAKGNISVTVGL